MPFPERLTQLDAQLGGGFTGVRWQASSRWPAFSVPHVKNPLLSSSVLLSHTLALPMGNVKPWFGKRGSWKGEDRGRLVGCTLRRMVPTGDRRCILSVCGFVGCGCSGRNAREKSCLGGSSSGHGNIDSWRRMGLDGFPL